MTAYHRNGNTGAAGPSTQWNPADASGPVYAQVLKWRRTPWWCFWRPKWRRYADQGLALYEYATDEQLARWHLDREFSPRGGGA